MKNLLRFTLIVCLMFSITNMQAQIKFGPALGLNLSTMKVKSNLGDLYPKTIVGFNVGVISEFSLTSNLFLQPALLFSIKGSKFTITGEGETDTPSFIEIPVNVVYKFGSGSTKFFLNAGPYFAYGIGGKIKWEGESDKIKFGSGENDDYKAFDYGLNLGAGGEIDNFIISAHYELGLANLMPGGDANDKLNNRVIGLSIGYLFGKK